MSRRRGRLILRKSHYKRRGRSPLAVRPGPRRRFMFPPQPVRLPPPSVQRPLLSMESIQPGFELHLHINKHTHLRFFTLFFSWHKFGPLVSALLAAVLKSPPSPCPAALPLPNTPVDRRVCTRLPLEATVTSHFCARVNWLLPSRPEVASSAVPLVASVRTSSGVGEKGIVGPDAAQRATKRINHWQTSSSFMRFNGRS